LAENGVPRENRQNAWDTWDAQEFRCCSSNRTVARIAASIEEIIRMDRTERIRHAFMLSASGCPESGMFQETGRKENMESSSFESSDFVVGTNRDPGPLPEELEKIMIANSASLEITKKALGLFFYMSDLEFRH
jgi:hypothetical protein